MLSQRVIIFAAMESEIFPIKRKMYIEKKSHHKKYSFYFERTGFVSSNSNRRWYVKK